MTTFWAEHAWLPEGCVAGVRLEVVGDRFRFVTRGVPAGPGDEILCGVVLPGLANGHSHAFHRALRGRTHDGGGTFWTWRRQMYAVAAQLDPDRYLTLARAVYAEMALAGYTVVGEFHYLHHDHRGRRYADPNAMGAALIEAAADAGIRLTLLDACYLAGGLNADGHLPLDAVQKRFSDGTVDRWQARVDELSDTATVRVGAAVHSVRAVPAEAQQAMRGAVGTRPLHVHLSEQPAENAMAQAFYGRTPTRLLARSWTAGAETTAVHATHLTDADVADLGESRTTVCICPTTERDLADGIGPARALAEAGCALILGSDQNAVIDPFEELRGLEMHDRLMARERGRFSPTELITAAGSGWLSAAWAGRRPGHSPPGALADFVVVRTDSVRTMGTRPAQIAYAATGADVDRVVVGGRTVVQDGEHRLGSVSALLSEALGRLDQEQP